MSEDLEWQADKEAGWEPGGLETVSRATRPRQRFWRVFFFAFVALVAGGIFVYWLMSRHMNERITAVKLDVLATNNLILYADQQRDVSLISEALAQENPNWVKWQKELAQRGLLFGRTPFRLSLLQHSGHSFDLADQDSNGLMEYFKEIDVSPDLGTATVTSDLVYLIDHGNQVTETVILQHTKFYTRAGDRWRLVPPEPGFWGQWMTISEEHLSLRFPERDREIGERLAVDLETILGRMCQSLADVVCPDDLFFSVYLESDPGSLATMSETAIMLSDCSPVKLPAPTLAGVPVDEAGYQALLNGYASHIVAAFIKNHVGWRCCEKGLFFQALLDKQLSQLKIRPWPLTEAEYRAMFRHPVMGITRLQPLWRKAPDPISSQTTWRQIYSLVDFILESNPDYSPTILQRQLVSSDDYGSWLAKNGFNTIGPELQSRWLQFVQGKLNNQPVPLPFPDQDILLLCSSDSSDIGKGALYRYDLDSGQIVSELNGRVLPYMVPLPGDEGVLLQERPFEFFPPEVLAWQGGRILEVASQETDMVLFPIDSTNPNRILFYSHEADREEVLYSQFNEESCRTGRCGLQSLQGFPVWSPDGRHTIVTNDGGMLWMGDAEGRIESTIGRGYYPFWIDNNIYGCVDKEPEEAIVITSILEPEARAVMPLERLITTASLDFQADQLNIHSISARHDEQNKLLIAFNINDGRQQDQDRALLASYNLATGEATELLRLEQAFTPYQPLRFSPDGRWLAIQNLDRTRTYWQLHLLNLQSKQTQVVNSIYRFAYPDYDWSSDGRWLLRIDREFLYLFAPEYDYQHVIFHGFSNCFSAAWVNNLQ